MSTWISRIAYNAAANHLERVGRAVDLDLSTAENEGRLCGGDNPAEVVSDKQISLILRAAVDELPPVCGLVLTLYHLEDFTYEEIAGIVNLPMGTVKSHLFRARRRLKAVLLSRYRLEEVWH
jgi:RNA polymerase sigma-70 factor (ECF subfamily)